MRRDGAGKTLLSLSLYIYIFLSLSSSIPYAWIQGNVDGEGRWFFELCKGRLKKEKKNVKKFKRDKRVVVDYIYIYTTFQMYVPLKLLSDFVRSSKGKRSRFNEKFSSHVYNTVFEQVNIVKSKKYAIKLYTMSLVFEQVKEKKKRRLETQSLGKIFQCLYL